MQSGWWWVAAALVMAGCAGPAETTESNIGSTAKETVVEGPGENATLGRVQGTVLAPSGLAIRDALVLILSIENSVHTNASGAFEFPAVKPGQQTLRVEKPDHQTLVTKVNVVAGKTSSIEVVLVPVEGLDPGFLEHFHDHWRGAQRYTVFDGTLEWETEMEDPPLLCQGIISGDVPYDDRACRYLDIFPDEGRIVPPGTTSLEITLDYESLDGMRPYLYVDPPDYECKIGDYCYNTKVVFPEPGQPFVLELEPLWTDHGHASTTGWAFYIYWANAVNVAGVTSVSAPVGGWFWNDLMKGPVDVKIEAIKGSLEIDPPHPRFWSDTQSIVLQDTTQYLLCLACTEYERSPTIQTRNDCRGHCFVLMPGDIVPPGATRLEFNFTVAWNGGVAPVEEALDMRPEFVLGYKTPDFGLKHGTWDDFIWPEPVASNDPPGGQASSYSIALTSDHADTWYDTFSQWMFSIAIKGETHADRMEMPCPTYQTCSYPRLTLSGITVYNDEVEAQREAGLI